MSSKHTRREVLDSLEGFYGHRLTADREHAVITSAWCSFGQHQWCHFPEASLFVCDCMCHVPKPEPVT